MNTNKSGNTEDEMRPEYDLSQLKGKVRGKYVERYRAGTNLVLLESDVQAAFPDAEAVNEALRMLMKALIVKFKSRLEWLQWNVEQFIGREGAHSDFVWKVVW